MTLKLVIGNKNYSSWSMRPWLALRASNIAFEEIFIPLYTDNPADKERILNFSRAGKVPALIDGDVTVWDSLSDHRICRRALPASEALAGGSRRASTCAFDLGRNAFLLRAVAQRMPHEPAPPNSRCRVIRRSACRHCAHPTDLERVPGAARHARSLPVRRILQRRRDVCARGSPFPHLLDCRLAGGRGLHGDDDRVAGICRVERSGTCRDAHHRTD